MKQGIQQRHFRDKENRPAGGHTWGTGFAIAWQSGPLGPPNGAFVEDVIQAVIGRIQEYQASQFACQDNADALAALCMAADSLDQRTKRRTEERTEGTTNA